MSIDIAAEIKFVFVSKGEYLVRLQDTEQTCIGKVLQADDGWKSYTIQPDQSWKGSFSSFGNTRYLASRSLLEAYELANGLRDSEGRRVTKDPETGLWFVANHYGGRESSRWTDKADAIAKLASLQPGAEVETLTIYKVVSHHSTGTQVHVFATEDEAVEAASTISPDTDGTIIPNPSDVVWDQFGGLLGDNYVRGIFWLRNRVASIFSAEVSGVTAKTWGEFFEFREIGRQAALNDEPAAPISNEKVREALQGRQVGDPFNVRIMEAFSKGYQAVRDEQAAVVLDGIRTPASEDELGVDDLEPFADGEDDEEDLVSTNWEQRTITDRDIRERVVEPMLTDFDGDYDVDAIMADLFARWPLSEWTYADLAYDHPGFDSDVFVEILQRHDLTADRPTFTPVVEADLAEALAALDREGGFTKLSYQEQAAFIINRLT